MVDQIFTKEYDGSILVSCAFQTASLTTELRCPVHVCTLKLQLIFRVILQELLTFQTRVMRALHTTLKQYSGILEEIP